MPIRPASLQPGIWAIVPVKRLRRAKSRLARALRVDQRAALARGLLARTLDILGSIDRIAGVAVISNDLTVHDIARAKGAVALAESEPGLNAAVSQACEWVAARGADGALIVPIDLPLLAAADVESILDLAAEPSCIVLAPDRREEGTNALLLRPPQALRPAFGPLSFEAHLARAAEARIAAHAYRSPGLALDIDLPADLDRYHELIRALDAGRRRESH